MSAARPRPEPGRHRPEPGRHRPEPGRHRPEETRLRPGHGALARAFRETPSGRAAFIPYIAAGDPSLECTRRFVAALAAGGADIVELGVPFSDPIADGPVNQRASERALASGTTLPGILDMVGGLRRSGTWVPIVLFTYANPVLRLGPRDFAHRCAAAGVDGVLVLDLPPEEAGALTAELRACRVDTVFLASPTTSPDRARLIGRAATGFVYYVSRLGVTGARPELPTSLGPELRRLRILVDKPVAVGFGISTPEQAAGVGRLADGVVVGSALVSLVERHPPAEAERRLRAAASAMTAALAEGRR